jgi:hypothetical protein
MVDEYSSHAEELKGDPEPMIRGLSVAHVSSILAGFPITPEK